MKLLMASETSTYVFAGIVLGIISILIIPLPPLCLDILFAIDLLFAGMVLITSIVIREPIEFAAFAPILLIATLFRLSLDVSATRLILTQANIPGGVGALIPAFGAFVVHGNLVVGIAIFSILTTIQFVVIASGAGRVAEVAARFTLDAMPGKQMSIDAEVHAGTMDAATAKVRRQRVQREADFFGAMDGAGKFIKGDAIAALVIVIVNLLGGLIVGMAMHGMAIADALATYALDSIGNALLTTLPSFLLSTAMGLLVTRVTADGSLGADLAAQLLGRPSVLRIAGGFSLVLALVPALPHVIFCVLGILLFLAASTASQRAAAQVVTTRQELELQSRNRLRRPEAALARVGVDALSIGFGSGLLGLCTADQGEVFLDRLADVRRVLAGELGVILPGIRLRDILDAEPQQYRIFVRGEVVAKGNVRLDQLLAVGEEANLMTFGGEATFDPVYGLKACYLPFERKAEAMQGGLLVFDPSTIISSHLAEVARSHAAKLLGRQELQTLLDYLRSSVPAVVKELTSERVGLGLLLRILHQLLEERIWPRDLVASLEIVLDILAQGGDERAAVAGLRSRLVPTQLRRSGVQRLTPLLLDPNLELTLREAWTGPAGRARMDPRLLAMLREEIQSYGQRVIRSEAALLCSAEVRSEVAQFVRRIAVEVPVYAFSEVPSEIELRPHQVVSLPAEGV